MAAVWRLFLTNQEAVMRALAISPRERTYTLIDYRGKSNPPAFKIKSMPKEQYLQLLADSNIKVPSAEQNVEITADFWQSLLQNYQVNIKVLEKHLTGWDNISDEMDEPLEYSKEAIQYLNEEVIAELVKEITGQVTEEEEKN